jgi:hypothetical protein
MVRDEPRASGAAEAIVPEKWRGKERDYGDFLRSQAKKLSDREIMLSAGGIPTEGLKERILMLRAKATAVVTCHPWRMRILPASSPAIEPPTIIAFFIVGLS